MVELPDDPLEVIGTYSVPSTTYRLITLGPDLSLRTAYRPDFWRRKVVYERRGLVFDDAVVLANNASYHTYYRLINTREHGAAYRYDGAKLIGPLAGGVVGLGTYDGEPPDFDTQLALIFPDRVDVVRLNPPRAVGGIPLPGVVACLYSRAHWIFLTERGQIRTYYFSGNSVLVEVPEPVVEILITRPGGFLGRDGEIYHTGQRGNIERLAVRHTRPFVLRGGADVMGFEADGVAVTNGRVETDEIVITVALPPGEYQEVILLNGDLESALGLLVEEPVPVCRLLGEVGYKFTVDGVLRGREEQIEGILETSSDGDTTVVLR